MNFSIHSFVFYKTKTILYLLQKYLPMCILAKLYIIVLVILKLF